MLKVHCGIEGCVNAAALDSAGNGPFGGHGHAVPTGWMTLHWEALVTGAPSQMEKTISAFGAVVGQMAPERAVPGLSDMLSGAVGPLVDRVRFEAHICPSCAGAVKLTEFARVGTARVMQGDVPEGVVLE